MFCAYFSLFSDQRSQSEAPLIRGVGGFSQIGIFISNQYNRPSKACQALFQPAAEGDSAASAQKSAAFREGGVSDRTSFRRFGGEVTNGRANTGAPDRAREKSKDLFGQGLLFLCRLDLKNHVSHARPPPLLKYPSKISDNTF